MRVSSPKVSVARPLTSHTLHNITRFQCIKKILKVELEEVCYLLTYDLLININLTPPGTGLG